MQTIKILSDNLCNKIAAGEVIQRPVSVVKELVENSLDAGATDITVSIVNGGKDHIQVVDNGKGMSEDDLLLSFERHATSKISEFDDLMSIQTLGFRGEALASIASVAMVETRSCVQNNSSGFKIKIQGGKVTGFEPVSMKTGTVFDVKNLFFNTPARRKFLKETSTEYRHIVDMVRKFALGFPDIRFRFYSNSREIFLLAPGKLSKRIGDVFTERYTNNILAVSAQNSDLSIIGYIGDSSLSRSRHSEQYFYVNDRLIQDRKMNSAIYSGYHSFLEQGQFPFFVIKLTIDPAMIDVNVHPAKTEIKFKNEWGIYHFIKDTIRETLQKSIRKESPDIINQKKTNFTQPGESNPFETKTHSKTAFNTKNSNFQMKLPDPERLEKIKTGNGNISLNERIQLFESSLGTTDFKKKMDIQPVMWQAHNSFIFAQIASGVVIVDQHLAHIRILYDRSIKAFSKASAEASQQLLFPVSISLKADDYSLLLEIFPLMEKLGFGMRDFGKNTVIVEAVPSDLRHIDEGKMILDIIEEYKSTRKSKNQANSDLAASYAKKAAIRHGDKLGSSEMQQLIDELFQSENPYYCPMGKSIIINLSKRELLSRFK